MISFMHDNPLPPIFRNPYKLLEAAGLKPGQRVLEVRCGSGFFTIPVAKIVGNEGFVHAVDVHPRAIESPKLRATLSMPLRSAFLGKRAAMSVYPGKKRIKGNPRTMRSGFEGNRVMIMIRRMERIFIAASSFSDFILKRPPACGKSHGFQ